MKRILLLITILLLPISVYASSVSINVNCSKTVLRPSESTTCSLVGRTDVPVGSANFFLTADSGLTISNFKKNSGLWTMGDLVGTEAALLTSSPAEGIINIGTFTITADASIPGDSINAQVRVTNIEMSVPSQNFAVIKGANNSVTIKISKTASNTTNGGNTSTNTGTIGNNTNTNTNTSVNTNTNTNTNTSHGNGGGNTNTTHNTNTNTNTNTTKPNTNTNTSKPVNNTTNTTVNTNTNTNTSTNPNIVVEEPTNNTSLNNKTEERIKDLIATSSKTDSTILSISNLILTLSFIAVFTIGVFIGMGFEKRRNHRINKNQS